MDSTPLPTYIYTVSNDQIGMLYNLKYVVK